MYAPKNNYFLLFSHFNKNINITPLKRILNHLTHKSIIEVSQYHI
jgi:hypothetical protein